MRDHLVSPFRTGRLAILTVAVILVFVPAGAAAQGLAPDPSLLELADQALREGNRQHAVRQQTGRVITQLDAIITELQHNDLLDRGNARQLLAARQSLSRVHDQHVPEAERLLLEARRQLERLRPQLDEAGQELEVISSELRNILDEMGMGARSQALAQQLRSLIEQEQQLHESTEDWGREALSDPLAVEERRDRIAQRQDEIGEQLERFEFNLELALAQASSAQERSRTEAVRQTLEQGQVGQLLDEAAHAIRQDDPFTALDAQEGALDLMRHAAQELARDDAPPELAHPFDGTLLEDIDQLRRQQQELAEQSRNTAQAGEPLAQHQPQQEALGDQAERMRNFSPGGETAQALDQAQQAMQQAAQAMQRGDPMMTQEAQEQAIAALDQAGQAAQEAMDQLAALMEAANQVANLMQQQQQLMGDTQHAQPGQLGELGQQQGDLGEQTAQMSPQMPLPTQGPMQQAAQAMGDAAQALEQQQQGQGMQAQQQAIAALQEAMIGLMGQMGQMGPMGQMMQAQMPGLQPGMIGTGMAQGQMPGDQPGQDDRPGGLLIGGAEPDAGDVRWQTLGPRERQELQQRFARELPVEYRALLEAYYETLSE